MLILVDVAHQREVRSSSRDSNFVEVVFALTRGSRPGHGLLVRFVVDVGIGVERSVVHDGDKIFPVSNHVDLVIGRPAVEDDHLGI